MNIWRNKFRPWQKIDIYNLEKREYYDFTSGAAKVSLIDLRYNYEPEKWYHFLWPLFHIKFRIAAILLSILMVILPPMIFAINGFIIPAIIIWIWVALTSPKYGECFNYRK